MSLILPVDKYSHRPSLTTISACDKDLVNKLAKEQNLAHNMENDIRTKTGLTGPSAGLDTVEGVDEVEKMDEEKEDEGWSVEEVAESREGVETVIDWPVAVAVAFVIASCTLVESVADDDAKVVV